MKASRNVEPPFILHHARYVAGPPKAASKVKKSRPRPLREVRRAEGRGNFRPENFMTGHAGLSLSWCELCQVIDAHPLFKTRNLSHDFFKAVFTKELMLLVFELFAQRIVFV